MIAKSYTAVPRARRAGLIPPVASTRPRPEDVLDVRLSKKGDRNSFIALFEADPLSRVAAIKKGIRPEFVDEIASEMRISKERLLPALGLSVATVNRKKSDAKPLSREESERVLGVARLVGQVEAMVEQSGDPAGFNAAQWVARWLEEPLPALGGRRPADLIDTSEGLAIVSNLLARAQGGTYA